MLYTVTAVEKEHYSWGRLIKIRQGLGFSIILHPNHQQMISMLDDGESVAFRDETNKVWQATLIGDRIRFQGLTESNYMSEIAASDLT